MGRAHDPNQGLGPRRRVAVALGALVRNGEGWQVFVVESGKVLAKTVSISDCNADSAWVKSGLKAGETEILFQVQPWETGIPCVGGLGDESRRSGCLTGFGRQREYEAGPGSRLSASWPCRPKAACGDPRGDSVSAISSHATDQRFATSLTDFKVKLPKVNALLRYRCKQFLACSRYAMFGFLTHQAFPPTTQAFKDRLVFAIN